ncbi:hypothetical protein [Elioraea sp.]|uniref:hypothetical protein n=1 Tax=Elioraea sp. TaxID=2185103 RepID=UPI003F6FC8FE
MSRAAPTPGPWRAQAGLVIADAPGPHVVAQTYSPGGLARWPHDPAERDANTRLIAAAPDMLREIVETAGMDLERVEAMDAASLRALLAGMVRRARSLRAKAAL